MIWLLVVVVNDATVVFGPNWVEAQEQLTLGDLLEQVSGKDFLEFHVGVKTGKDEHSPTHTATLSQPLMTFYSYGDRFVKFVVDSSSKEKTTEPKSAVSVLMRSIYADHLPAKHNPVNNKKQLLFNDICSLLNDKKVGFLPDEVPGIGYRFVQTLTDVLWYIDGHYHKFESRCKHGKVPPIPDIFLSLIREAMAMLVATITGYLKSISPHSCNKRK